MISRVVLLLLALSLVGTAFAYRAGVCYISATSITAGSTGVRGRIYWDVSVSTSTFTFELEGLGANRTRGWHGHTYGAIYTNTASAVGGHYDPRGTNTHANYNDGLPETAHHAGDFGNVTSDANGFAMYILDNQFTEISDSDGTRSFLGRAVIIHADPDLGFAFNSSNGNAGQRIGQCVMQSLQSSFTAPVGVMYATVELKKDISALASQGRIAVMDNGDGSLNYKVRICGLAAFANVTIQPGTFNDLNTTSTFENTGLPGIPLTANANGVVDVNVNSTDFTLGSSSPILLARPVAVLDASGAILMRGVVGVAQTSVPLTATAGSTVIIPTCDPSGPTPGGSTTPTPGGNAGQLFMGVSTILLIIASLFMF